MYMSTHTTHNNYVYALQFLKSNEIFPNVIYVWIKSKIKTLQALKLSINFDENRY